MQPLYYKPSKKTSIFRKIQVLHIADINVREIFFAYILVCWSYENGKNLPAPLNLTKSVNVVHPTTQEYTEALGTYRLCTGSVK